MKKTMLSLIALLVMAVQSAGAQNYEVEYQIKFDPVTMAKIMAGDDELPAEVMESIKNDINNAEIYVAINMSNDKEDSKLLVDKSSMAIHIMGQTIDMIPMIESMELSTYTDCTKKESYVKMHYQGTSYLIKNVFEGKTDFTPSEGTKTVLGHECRAMADKDGNKVWYAADIPFEYAAYGNIPGLVLAMEVEGLISTAVKITPNDREMSLPGDARIVTREEMQKIMK